MYICAMVYVQSWQQMEKIHWKSIFFARVNSKTKDIIDKNTDSDS